MNKTLALIAALGLIIATPAFAAETPATGTDAAAATSTDTTAQAPAKTEQKAEAKSEKKLSKLKPAAGKHKKKKATEDTTTQQ